MKYYRRRTRTTEQRLPVTVHDEPGAWPGPWTYAAVFVVVLILSLRCFQ